MTRADATPTEPIPTVRPTTRPMPVIQPTPAPACEWTWPGHLCPRCARDLTEQHATGGRR